MSKVEFFVRGKPEPQGSARAFVVKGRPVITSTNKNLKDWRSIVADVAQGVVDEPFYGAIKLDLVFILPRPASLVKKHHYPTKKPDLDKLVRSICDALTHVVWRDDSQVVDLTASKRYESPLDPVGVRIKVEEFWVLRPGRISSIVPSAEVL